jgi:hypothetical protein
MITARVLRLLSESLLVAAVVLTSGVPLFAQQAVVHASSPFPKKISESADAPQRQGFSLVLLLGDMQGVDAQEALPASARRALADMKDFLPYKSYRVLDTQWTLCCSSQSSTSISRLRGVEDQEYEVELRSTQEPAGRLSVRFFLREPAPFRTGMAKTADPDRASRIDSEIFALEQQLIDLTAEQAIVRQKSEVGLKDPADLPRLNQRIATTKDRIQTLKRDLPLASHDKSSDGRSVIDTTFRMDVGETVVVGTSRLKGGSRALIALLTAVPAKTKRP